MEMELRMRDNVVPIRSKAVDSEKITINLGYVDLGQIDLLVQEGFYSNRTDFIRTAIRNQLQRHAEVVNASTARKSLDPGLCHYTRERLEAAQRDGEVIEINVCWALPQLLRMSPPTWLEQQSGQ
jgi:Arc/MetJ-type ribon-helix-helix transcriptional regulator